MEHFLTKIGGRVRSGLLSDRKVDLHVHDGCKLDCSKCSSFSPQERTVLPLGPLLQALPRLRAEGYEVIALSGGEPFLYPLLPELLAAAKAEGFRTAAITSGFCVTARHRATIEAIDDLAVSFDGMGAEHDRIGGNPGGWVAAIAGLRFLAEIGKPATAVYTVSRATLDDIPRFVELCASLAVRSVRFRPLVMAGCASDMAADSALSAADLARLWLMAQTLELAWQGEVEVKVDLAPAEALATDASAWDLVSKGGAEQRLSDAVNPLVITPDGILRPYSHDFPEEFDLGRLHDLAPERRVWIDGGLPRLRKLLAKTLHAAALEDGVLDWFAFQRDQARPLSSLPA